MTGVEMTVGWEDLRVGDQILQCNTIRWGGGPEYTITAIGPSKIPNHFGLSTTGWTGVGNYHVGGKWFIHRPSATIATVAAVDGRFPHKCPKCAKPAYVGFTSVECSAC